MKQDLILNLYRKNGAQSSSIKTDPKEISHFGKAFLMSYAVNKSVIDRVKKKWPDGGWMQVIERGNVFINLSTTACKVLALLQITLYKKYVDDPDFRKVVNEVSKQNEPKDVNLSVEIPVTEYTKIIYGRENDKKYNKVISDAIDELKTTKQTLVMFVDNKNKNKSLMLEAPVIASSTKADEVDVKDNGLLVSTFVRFHSIFFWNFAKSFVKVSNTGMIAFLEDKASSQNQELFWRLFYHLLNVATNRRYLVTCDLKEWKKVHPTATAEEEAEALATIQANTERGLVYPLNEDTLLSMLPETKTRKSVRLQRIKDYLPRVCYDLQHYFGILTTPNVPELNASEDEEKGTKDIVFLLADDPDERRFNS